MMVLVKVDVGGVVMMWLIFLFLFIYFRNWNKKIHKFSIYLNKCVFGSNLKN